MNSLCVAFLLLLQVTGCMALADYREWEWYIWFLISLGAVAVLVIFWYLFRTCCRGRNSSPFNNQMPNNPMGNQFGTPMGNQFGTPMGNQFGTPMGNQLGSPMTRQFGIPMGGPVRMGSSSPMSNYDMAPQSMQMGLPPAVPMIMAPPNTFEGDLYGAAPYDNYY